MSTTLPAPHISTSNNKSRKVLEDDEVNNQINEMLKHVPQLENMFTITDKIGSGEFITSRIAINRYI